MDTAKYKILETKIQKLREIAHYNLNLPGKQFRSAILLLLAQALIAADPANHHLFNQSQSPGQALTLLKTKYKELYDKIVIFAAAIEVVHNASLLQDDILDQSESRRAKAAAYRVFGESDTLFTSTFLIGRGSHALTLLDNPHLSQIYATIAKNLVDGEHIQARKMKEFSDLEKVLEEYTLKSYYKTASMIALGCRGVAMILNRNIEDQRHLFNFGANLGIAFQIRDDLLDFIMSEEVLGKPSHQDLKEGLITAPTIYAIAEDPKELVRLIGRKFKDEAELKRAIEIIHEESKGLQMTELLVIEQVAKALQDLNSIDWKQESQAIQALRGVCRLVDERKK